MHTEDLTLAQIFALENLAPDKARNARRLCIEGLTYEQFVDLVYEDVELCLLKMEEDPKVRLGDSEDRLTSEIVNRLDVFYDASHDETMGGHGDMLIRGPGPNNFVVVFEAKIHSDYDYLMGGFNQLTTRYIRGTVGRDRGALIIYIRNSNASAVVRKWREYLAAQQLPGYKDEDCLIREDLGFRTIHLHTGTGRELNIRHMGVHLHWNPVN